MASADLLIVSPACPVCGDEDLRPVVSYFMNPIVTVEGMRATPVRCAGCGWAGAAGDIRIVFGDQPTGPARGWGHG